MTIHYDKDFHAWAVYQAERLRTLKPDGLDWENMAEELDALARREAREVTHRLATLLRFLLKYQYQPNLRSRSWALAVVRERECEIPDLLRDNPSLEPKLPDLFRKAYRQARFDLLIESGLDERNVPRDCPYRLDEAMDPEFYPE
jgi:hypothetical protein